MTSNLGFYGHFFERIDMSLKFKANRIGDIAIISAIIVSGVCMFSIVIDIPFGEFITAFFMFLYLEMREKYIEIRKQEIDEELSKEGRKYIMHKEKWKKLSYTDEESEELERLSMLGGVGDIDAHVADKILRETMKKYESEKEKNNYE